LQKAIRMQTESMDSPRWREPIIFPKEEHALMHEARIRRELILNYI
jgi:hypothetical protein